MASEPITDIDSTAADVLADLDNDLNRRGVNLVFAEMKDPVRDRLRRYGLESTIDPAHFYATLDQAVEAARTAPG